MADHRCLISTVPATPQCHEIACKLTTNDQGTRHCTGQFFWQNKMCQPCVCSHWYSATMWHIAAAILLVHIAVYLGSAACKLSHTMADMASTETVAEHRWQYLPALHCTSTSTGRRCLGSCGTKHNGQSAKAAVSHATISGPVASHTTCYYLALLAACTCKHNVSCSSLATQLANQLENQQDQQECEPKQKLSSEARLATCKSTS